MMHATHLVIGGGSSGCDAAVMPLVSRTNTSIPTVMIVERIAEMVRQR
jgi:hypothetical protein